MTVQGVPAGGGVAASVTVAELETIGALITPALILGEPTPGVSAKAEMESTRDAPAASANAKERSNVLGSLKIRDAANSSMELSKCQRSGLQPGLKSGRPGAALPAN